MGKSKKPPQQNFEKWSPDSQSGNAGESLDINLTGGRQFATRARANDFARLMRSLPDPDPLLRRLGKNISALRELLTDSHLESVWSVRCSAASGGEWFVGAGEGSGAREQLAADSFADQIKGLDIPRIIEEMMDAVAYGYAPMEILWRADNGLWGIENVVGKPPAWFEFDPDNRLVFCGTSLSLEPVPGNRFLLIQHRPTYLNPYGDKVFSKCFWPATFKKRGWEWWTVFIEKYGGAFMYGKYPANAPEADKTALLDALEKMISDAVAIAPESSDITIESLANKGNVTNIHSEYINTANSEMSKAVLGQTLTTELSGRTGSYAATQAHNLVREDLAKADRRRVCAAFNRLASAYTVYNFGADVIPPKFQFVKDEDLQKDRAERDVKLFRLGWSPKKPYFAREYGIPEEYFDLIDGGGEQTAKEKTFAVAEPARRFSGHSSCGCGSTEKPNLFQRFLKLFTSKEEKAQNRDEKLMTEFAGTQLQAGQDEINKIVESFADALGAANSYESAPDALMKAYEKISLDGLAHRIDEARFAASGIGGSYG